MPGPERGVQGRFRNDAAVMYGLATVGGMVLTVVLEGTADAEDLRRLASWLGDESELRGRVTFVARPRRTCWGRYQGGWRSRWGPGRRHRAQWRSRHVVAPSDHRHSSGRQATRQQFVHGYSQARCGSCLRSARHGGVAQVRGRRWRRRRVGHRACGLTGNRARLSGSPLGCVRRGCPSLRPPVLALLDEGSTN